jgi:hypothetical protein
MNDYCTPKKVTHSVQKLWKKDAGDGRWIILSKGGDGRVTASTGDGDFNRMSSTLSGPKFIRKAPG